MSVLVGLELVVTNDNEFLEKPCKMNKNVGD